MYLNTNWLSQKLIFEAGVMEINPTPGKANTQELKKCMNEITRHWWFHSDYFKNIQNMWWWNYITEAILYHQNRSKSGLLKKNDITNEMNEC